MKGVLHLEGEDEVSYRIFQNLSSWRWPLHHCTSKVFRRQYKANTENWRLFVICSHECSLPSCRPHVIILCSDLFIYSLFLMNKIIPSALALQRFMSATCMWLFCVLICSFNVLFWWDKTVPSALVLQRLLCSESVLKTWISRQLSNVCLFVS